MIKPLLRIIPSISGNMKIACMLTDYIHSSEDRNTFNTFVRDARLYPISHKLMQQTIKVNLLGSAYEYDVKKFFNKYSDVFYTNLNEYSKIEMDLFDKTKSNEIRNTDFEMGCKRVSFLKSNNEFAFFAPIYIDNVDDIPSHMMIDVTFTNNYMSVTKHIKVNIGVYDLDDHKRNYLFRYLTEYVSKIDDVVFLNDINLSCGYYYGIDCEHGGFTKAKDNIVKNIYCLLNSINNFDAILCGGFKRNKIIMKLIIPLCFYFNSRDLLSDIEYETYKFSRIDVNGKYYDSNNEEIPYYDFNVNYDMFTLDVLKFDANYGKMSYKSGINVMNVGYPSMLESTFEGYMYSNKIAPTYNRWKLIWSDDEHPYIANNSWAFTKLYSNSVTYGEYPSQYSIVKGLVNNKVSYNSLLMPFNTSAYGLYNSFYTYKENYISAFNRYAFSWFEIYFGDLNEDIFSSIEWKNVRNNKVYYKGVMYDVDNMYDEIGNKIDIDKFAIILKPVLKDDRDYKSAKYVISKNVKGTDNTITINNDFIDSTDNIFIPYATEDSESVEDVLFKNNVRFKKDVDGNYVDISSIINESNVYYDLSKILISIDNCIDSISEKLHTSNSEYNKKVTSTINILNHFRDLFTSFEIDGFELLDIPKFLSYINNELTVFDDFIYNGKISKETKLDICSNLYNVQVTLEENEDLYKKYKIYSNKKFINYSKSNIDTTYNLDNTIVFKSKFISMIDYGFACEQKGSYADSVTTDDIIDKNLFDTMEAIKNVYFYSTDEVCKYIDNMISNIKNVISYRLIPILYNTDNNTIIGKNVFSLIDNHENDDYIYVDPYNLYKILLIDSLDKETRQKEILELMLEFYKSSSIFYLKNNNARTYYITIKDFNADNEKISTNYDFYAYAITSVAVRKYSYKGQCYNLSIRNYKEGDIVRFKRTNDIIYMYYQFTKDFSISDFGNYMVSNGYVKEFLNQLDNDCTVYDLYDLYKINKYIVGDKFKYEGIIYNVDESFVSEYEYPTSDYIEYLLSKDIAKLIYVTESVTDYEYTNDKIYNINDDVYYVLSDIKLIDKVNYNQLITNDNVLKYLYKDKLYDVNNLISELVFIDSETTNNETITFSDNVNGYVTFDGEKLYNVNSTQLILNKLLGNVFLYTGSTTDKNTTRLNLGDIKHFDNDDIFSFEFENEIRYYIVSCDENGIDIDLSSEDGSTMLNNCGYLSESEYTLLDDEIDFFDFLKKVEMFDYSSYYQATSSFSYDGQYYYVNKDFSYDIIDYLTYNGYISEYYNYLNMLDLYYELSDSDILTAINSSTRDYIDSYNKIIDDAHLHICYDYLGYTLDDIYLKYKTLSISTNDSEQSLYTYEHFISLSELLTSYNDIVGDSDNDYKFINNISLDTTTNLFDGDIIRDAFELLNGKDTYKEFELYYKARLYKIDTYLLTKMINEEPKKYTINVNGLQVTIKRHNSDLYLFVKESNSSYNGNILIMDGMPSYGICLNIGECYKALFNDSHYLEFDDTLLQEELYDHNIILSELISATSYVRMNSNIIQYLYDASEELASDEISETNNLLRNLLRYSIIDYPLFENIKYGDVNNYYDKYDINVVNYKGENYAFYMYQFTFDNTSTSLSLVTNLSSTPQYITKINGKDIFSKQYINELYTENVDGISFTFNGTRYIFTRNSEEDRTILGYKCYAYEYMVNEIDEETLSVLQENIVGFNDEDATLNIIFLLKDFNKYKYISPSYSNLSYIIANVEGKKNKIIYSSIKNSTYLPTFTVIKPYINSENGSKDNYQFYNTDDNGYELNYDIRKMIINLFPFVKYNLYNEFKKQSHMILPTLYTYDLHYVSLHNNNTDEKESTAVYRNKKIDTIQSYRYLIELTPLITNAKNIVYNTYNRKYKYTSNTLLNGGNHKWNGNYTLYTLNLNIDTFNGIRVYHEDDITKYDTYYPIEYKHFNDSLFIMLPQEIEIDGGDCLTYDELVALESDETTFEKFNEYISEDIIEEVNDQVVEDEEKYFLFLRYKVLYDSEAIGVTDDGTEKIYKLKYKFILL